MKKDIIKKVFIFLWILFLFTLTSCNKEITQVNDNKNTIILSDNSNNMIENTKTNSWELTSHLTFKLSDKVNIKKVTYKNRYWITIAAHLYTSKDLDISRKYPAIVIWTPYGWVKEQWAWIYAQNMAEKWFVAIAFDESYNWESSWEPRHTSSPDVFVEDFSAWIDYLWTLWFIDREKIWAIGICGSAWFALTATQVDHRIKAVVTASMYDMSRVKRNGWKDINTTEQIQKNLDDLATQRWKDVDNNKLELSPSFPEKMLDKLPEWLDPITSEFFEYYTMARGYHPNSIWAFTKTSDMAFNNFPLLNYVDTISPRPILFIMWEKAHSKYFTEDVYKKALEPKELVVVAWARHIDLYDGWDKNYIPFDKIESFFKQYLK